MTLIHQGKRWCHYCGKFARHQSNEHFALREKQVERARKIKREWNRNHREQCRKSLQRWRKSNPGKVYEQQRRWRLKYPQKAAGRAVKWRKQNPDKSLFNAREYRNRNRAFIRSLWRSHYQRNARKIRSRITEAERKSRKLCREAYLKHLLRHKHKITNPTNEQIEQHRTRIQALRSKRFFRSLAGVAALKQ